MIAISKKSTAEARRTHSLRRDALRRFCALCASAVDFSSKRLAFLLALTLLAVVAQAQDPTPSPSPDVVEGLSRTPAVAPDYRADNAVLPELGRVGVDLMKQRPLSLREALTLALENNRDIEISRKNVKLAEFDLQAARGSYDPRLFFQSYYERVETPVTNVFGGAGQVSTTQTTFNNTARLEGLAPRFGGTYRVEGAAPRVSTDNPFTFLNPLYQTSLTFSYTQPLLRGKNFDQTRRNIEVTKRNLSLTDAQFRQKTIEVITNAQRSYWDLVFSLRNLQVQRDAVRDARRQLDHNKRLVSEGVLAPMDIVSAEAQVAVFEQNVYAALDEVSRAENTLKNLLAENRRAALWNVAIFPTDNADLDPPAIALEDALNAALSNRPELQQNDLALAINQLDQRLAREQTRPQVDLVGSYGVNGLAGNTNAGAANPFTGSGEATRLKINQIVAAINNGVPGNNITPLPAPAPTTLPAELVGNYGQSLTNLALNRFNNYRVGVTINLPLKNRAAEAQLGRSLVEGERLQTLRDQLEQLIQMDVRNSLQTVRTAQARLRAAAAQRQAAEQQYASEQRKFDAAQSTIFLVLERQTALTNAKGAELRAQTDLNKAIAELQRATGNSLQANDVVVRIR
jgi:HAE1 family hydrophobic/amphiphilic exporter-1